jgi:plasmid stabilization system protein ParE
MAKKEIVWSNHAKVEFSTVLEFYFLRNGNANYSKKLVGEVEGLLKTVSKSHLIGRLTSNKVTRVVVMDVYLIFYEVNDKQIEIISFWDNRQSMDKRKIQ